MKKRNFKKTGIGLSILLPATALLILQLSGGGRLTASDSDEPMTEAVVSSRVIAEHPPVEIVEKRDDHTRIWEIVREVETTHPDGSTTVDTVKSYIHEKASGLCYKDATGNYVPSVPEWRETPDGFVVDRCPYKLSVGKTLGSWLAYEVEGRQVWLRTFGLMASDGQTEVSLAVANPDVKASLGPESPSTLSFRDALGEGLHVELVAEKDGFHQNVVLPRALQIPPWMRPEQTHVYLYTEINLDDYAGGSACGVSVGGIPVDLRSDRLVTQPSPTDRIAFRRAVVTPEGKVRDETVWWFTESKVFDSSGWNQTQAARQLFRDASGAPTYLVESIPWSFLNGALFPVVLDYQTRLGAINEDQTWGLPEDDTYFVSGTVTVSNGATLTILPGTVVKLNGPTPPPGSTYLEIRIDEGGKVVAEGNEANCVVFTKATDGDYGDTVTGARAGQYGTALYLYSGSSPQSKIRYCKMLYGICPINCQQPQEYAFEHNIIDGKGDGATMYYGIKVGTGGAADCINNLIYDSDWLGIDYYHASAGRISNNTIHGGNVGIQLQYSDVTTITDNLLTGCVICGISVDANSNVTFHHNGFWRCATPMSPPGQGAGDVVLPDTDDPYVGDREFFLNQSCGFINAGSTTAIGAGLQGHTTSHAIEEPDGGQVDLGFHYPILLRPYLQNVKADRITVMWHSKAGGTGYVDWGPDANYGQMSSDSSPDYLGNLYYIFEVELTGLQAGTEYHYRVRRGSMYSPDAPFRTASTGAENFWFAAYGDNRGVGAQTFREEHQKVANAILEGGRFRPEPRPRFVLHVGDFVNTGGNVPEWRPDFFDPASPLLAWTPLFPSIGNHELSGTEGLDKYRRLFCVDTGTPGYQERWYSFYYGNCKIICLDSNLTGAERQDQQNWLEGQLDDTTRTWKFVLLHHPAFSDGLQPSGTWTSHDGTASGEAHAFRGDAGMQYAYDTLALKFRQHGVDIVFCGHNHFYERSGDDTDQTTGIGPTYAVTGGGGAPGSSALHHSPDFAAVDNPKRQYAEPAFQHVTVDVMSNKLLIKAFRNNGSVLDFDARDTSDHFLREARARTMIVQGAAWKYYQLGYPGDGWTAYSFNDASWPSGPARIGFGHPEKESTTIGAGYRNQMTYYFRNKFNAGIALSTVDFAFLEVLHDDGCVVYLNGVEVFRSNLPPSSSHGTAALNSVQLPFEDNFIRCLIDKSLLQAENNILAVEVHRVSLANDDMAFNFRLKYFAEAWW